MDITIYKELIDLINKHCNWAIVEDKLDKNHDGSDYFTIHSPKTLLVRFCTENRITSDQNMLQVWEWNMEKAITIMETDIKFKHRVKMHACTPSDADQWLQIAVFGNIILK